CQRHGLWLSGKPRGEIQAASYRLGDPVLVLRQMPSVLPAMAGPRGNDRAHPLALPLIHLADPKSELRDLFAGELQNGVPKMLPGESGGESVADHLQGLDTRQQEGLFGGSADFGNVAQFTTAAFEVLQT